VGPDCARHFGLMCITPCRFQLDDEDDRSVRPRGSLVVELLEHRTAAVGMVGPNGLEPSTSSVSRKRSNQTELRAYTWMAVLQF
jgi:hypothetical protein